MDAWPMHSEQSRNTVLKTGDQGWFGCEEWVQKNALVRASVVENAVGRSRERKVMK